MRSPASVGCQYFDRAWNRREPTAVSELCTPDVRAHGADGVTRNLAEFEAFRAVMLAAIPDLQMTVNACVEAGDSAAVQWTAVGTHSADTPELGPATHTRITVSGLSLLRLRDGRIAEGWDDYDFAGLMRQLGAGV